MRLVRRGRPTVDVIAVQFVRLAGAVMRANKLPESTMVIVPGNPEYVPKEQVIAWADGALAEIAGKLGSASPA